MENISFKMYEIFNEMSANSVNVFNTRTTLMDAIHVQESDDMLLCFLLQRTYKIFEISLAIFL